MIKKAITTHLKWQFFSLFCLLCLSACKQESHPYSFYYWRTNLTLNNAEHQALQNADDKLYVRYFDVDKRAGKFQALASVVKQQSFVTDKRIVPVVFITNRTFLYITDKELNQLAQKIADTIEKKSQRFGLHTADEIQIDCDWTAGTRDDYFKFLQILQKITGKEISITLRLHQVKFKDNTGVPPVNKVFLMCYSTSSPLKNSDKNSILDVALLKNYLKNIDDYPIENITVALPIYSWGIVTNHLGKHKLINALNKQSLENKNFKKLGNNEVEVLQDNFYFGFFLNKGFRIKVEEISPQQLQQVVDFLNKKIGKYDIIYYHLDSRFVDGRELSL
ncbi:hypothetical protein QJU43_05795 [Pasteurella atlantica]|uniref:hypothetical protein n=1 Tax=Pasteurellaceae TaxID=712 RepID=UPI00276043EE|nr:hypothetical protein [Pasteurella atlantica]MDP8033959.1 hypothetical protein [Pasteurella atlantica]MDP8035832.1 hypothetical protein [Pasteurella atlantica]MDP8037843.1 hypothetical protein [Pasteurella atlantica]MDP8048181.1 hypothetical protein [Pasteurella atlantica]MDP8050141.1 hypothetical protein [Pasteurella atlantica]